MQHIPSTFAPPWRGPSGVYWTPPAWCKSISSHGMRNGRPGSDGRPPERLGMHFIDMLMHARGLLGCWAAGLPSY